MRCIFSLPKISDEVRWFVLKYIYRYDFYVRNDIFHIFELCSILPNFSFKNGPFHLFEIEDGLSDRRIRPDGVIEELVKNFQILNCLFMRFIHLTLLV